MEEKAYFKKKKRVVVKIGSSSINHEETGKLNFTKLEKLVRELFGTPERHFYEAGMRGGGTGKAHDDISENVC